MSPARPPRRRLALLAWSVACLQLLPAVAVRGQEIEEGAARAVRAVSGPSTRVSDRLSDEQVYQLLRRQLRALLVAQDEVRAERGRFARGFGTSAEQVAFVPPAGVTVRFEFADSGGWSAVATHALLPGRSCALWVGGVPPQRRPETLHDANRGGEAEVVCDLVP